MLASHQGAYIAWGPTLTFLYNDGCIPILGRRHENALGQPCAQVWGEDWPALQPIVEAVLQGHSHSFGDRAAALQEGTRLPVAWLTCSWTPLRGDESRIAGFLCVAGEVTDKVLAQ